eukprot:15331287-Ditylum_brightwellii.AAC.1
MSGWNEQGQRFSSCFNPPTPRFPTPPNMLQRFHKPQYQESHCGYVEGSMCPHEHATSNSVLLQTHTQHMHAPAASQTNATPPDFVHHDVELQTPEIPPNQPLHFQQQTMFPPTEIPVGN